jgi:hypothetical protein
MNTNRTQSHCQAQLNHLDKWLVEYITIHRDLLKQTGIRCNLVYTNYKASTDFPVGLKTFGPHIRQLGIDRIKKGPAQYYVLFV